MKKSKDCAKKYFDAFEMKNINYLRGVLANEATLSDWNIDVCGFDAVIAEYINMFGSLNGIAVNVINLYEDEYTVIAELIVTANEIGSVRVVDIISFDKSGKILSIRAYKG